MLTQNMLAAIKACKEAVSTPGCLVRVTMKNVEQAEVVLWVSNYLSNTGQLDYDKTIANSLKGVGEATVELLNGSGIEFVLEK